MTPARVPRFLRWTVVLGLLVAAAAHVPVIPEHLHEAPYMGYAFIAFTVTAIAFATRIAARPQPIAYALSAVLCTGAVLAYVLTRMIAFPQLADDVGNWTETLGLVSITAETLVVALSTLAITRHTDWHRSSRSSAAAVTT